MHAEDVHLLQLDDNQTNEVVKRKGERRTTFKKNPLLGHVPSDETDLEIEEVNRANLSWKANTCLLQRHHPQYDHKRCQRKHERPLSLA